jgi:hypothetical protein
MIDFSMPKPDATHPFAMRHESNSQQFDAHIAFFAAFSGVRAKSKCSNPSSVQLRCLSLFALSKFDQPYRNRYGP